MVGLAFIWFQYSSGVLDLVMMKPNSFLNERFSLKFRDTSEFSLWDGV